MKKLTKIFALVLCLVMMFTLCACGKSDSELLVGTWEAEVDMSDDIITGMESELGDAMAYFELGQINAVVTLDFKEDGTYTMAMRVTDESEAEFNAAIKTGMQALMDDSVAADAETYGMTMEEYEAAYYESFGTTVEDDVNAYIDSALAEIDIQALLGDQTVEGKWKAAAGVLSLTESLEDDFSDGNYDVYEDLSETSFTLVDGFTDGESEEDSMYPMTFTKVA